MGWLERLVERRVLKARAEGKLQGLAGEGEPLPEHPEAAYVDAAEAAGFRIMAEAGALPQEIELKKAIAAHKAAMAAITDPVARKAAMARLAELEQRYAMAVEARKAFLRG